MACKGVKESCTAAHRESLCNVPENHHGQKLAVYTTDLIMDH